MFFHGVVEATMKQSQMYTLSSFFMQIIYKWYTIIICDSFWICFMKLSSGSMKVKGRKTYFTLLNNPFSSLPLFLIICC